MRASKVVRGSVTGAALARLPGRLRRMVGDVTGLERAIADAADRKLRGREAPLTFAAVAPVVSQSYLARVIVRAWRGLMAAVIASRTAAEWQRTSRAMQEISPAVAIRHGAAAVAIGAAMHCLLLLFAEQYHYPSRAALLLPVVIASVAALVAASSDSVARAVTDWRNR